MEIDREIISAAICIQPGHFSSADSKRAVVSYWRKYVHLVLVIHLGGLSQPRNSLIRLTAHHHMMKIIVAMA